MEQENNDYNKLLKENARLKMSNRILGVYVILSFIITLYNTLMG